MVEVEEGGASWSEASEEGGWGGGVGVRREARKYCLCLCITCA